MGRTKRWKAAIIMIGRTMARTFKNVYMDAKKAGRDR